MSAVRGGHVEVVEALLDAGAADKTGVLRQALENGRFETARKLLNDGADLGTIRQSVENPAVFDLAKKVEALEAKNKEQERDMRKLEAENRELDRLLDSAWAQRDRARAERDRAQADAEWYRNRP